MSTNNTIVPILADKLPEFVKELYPNFVQFMRDYIDWLEQEENFLRIILDWEHNIEPTNNVEPYIDALLKDLGFESGQNLAVDKHLILHLLRDFYLARGSEASFKFLFRALFNEDVSLRYPRDQLLIPSYASYGERHFIFTTAVNRDTEQYHAILNYVRENGGSVRGLSSGVIASIENIVIQHGSGVPYLRIEILQPSLEFEVNEGVIIEGGTTSISELIKPVLEIEIVDPGYGYTANDKIAVTGPSLQGQVTIDSVTKGGLTGVYISPGATGYQVGDFIKASPDDGGFGFAAYITVGGANPEYKVYNEGYNYTKIPALTSSHPEYKLQGLSTQIGGIQKISVISPYVDFDECVFSITSENGTGAILEARPVTRWSYHNWTDNRGVIGENSTLIDSDKYQQYSYTIVSSIAANNYDSFVSEMLHPAGYVKTSSYEIVSHLDLNLIESDVIVGGTIVLEYESILNLPFVATFEVDTMVMIVTDSDISLTTDLGNELIISE